MPKLVRFEQKEGRRNVFKDSEDKPSCVINLVGTTFKNKTFSKIAHFQGFVQKYGVDMSPSPNMFRRPWTDWSSEMKKKISIILKSWG